MVRGGLSAYGYGCTNGVEKRVDSGQTGDFSNGRSKFMSIYIQVHMRGSVVILKNAIYFVYYIYIHDPLIYLSTYRKSKGTHTNTQTYIPYSIFTEKRLREPFLPAQAHHMYTYIMSITQKEIVKNSIGIGTHCCSS